jgi:hypothetical protein
MLATESGVAKGGTDALGGEPERGTLWSSANGGGSSSLDSACGSQPASSLAADEKDPERVHCQVAEGTETEGEDQQAHDKGTTDSRQARRQRGDPRAAQDGWRRGNGGVIERLIER